MYLLIRMCSACVLICAGVFTSHYVSINSLNCWQSAGGICKFTSHYVSINSPSPLAPNISGVYNLHPTMYLLIRATPAVKTTAFSKFTSHYVSINSNDTTHEVKVFYNLHPTMYLLIPVIIKASLFLNSEALFCLPFKSANRLLILYALNMLEA